jgi:hypothetical protein
VARAGCRSSPSCSRPGLGRSASTARTRRHRRRCRWRSGRRTKGALARHRGQTLAGDCASAACDGDLPRQAVEHAAMLTASTIGAERESASNAGPRIAIGPIKSNKTLALVGSLSAPIGPRSRRRIYKLPSTPRASLWVCGWGPDSVLKHTQQIMRGQLRRSELPAANSRGITRGHVIPGLE